MSIASLGLVLPYLYNMPICILPANISLYAICPLYARIPLMHSYVYFITCMFVYSPYYPYIPIRALPILAPSSTPYLYRLIV
jgi:hypothetical protein